MSARALHTWLVALSAADWPQPASATAQATTTTRRSDNAPAGLPRRPSRREGPVATQRWSGRLPHGRRGLSDPGEVIVIVVLPAVAATGRRDARSYPQPMVRTRWYVLWCHRGASRLQAAQPPGRRQLRRHAARNADGLRGGASPRPCQDRIASSRRRGTREAAIARPGLIDRSYPPAGSSRYRRPDRRAIRIVARPTTARLVLERLRVRDLRCPG